MRYVALLLLLLLSLYFLILKPYMVSRRIHYDLEGLSFGFKPLHLRVKLFYLYLPFEGRYLFINLSNLSFEVRDKPYLSLGEGSAILVESEVVRKKTKGGSPPAFLIPEFLKDVELDVGRFLFTYAGAKNVNVLAEDLSLKERLLKGHLTVDADGLSLKVDVERVELLEQSIRVESLRVSSELFELYLKGLLKEGRPTAVFDIDGRLRELDFPSVRLSPVRLKGSGRADYRRLEVRLKAEMERLELKGRKTFSDLKASGLLELEVGGGLTLRGSLGSPVLEGDYSLELLPRRVLRLKVKRFPVDSELLGIEPFFFTWVGGSLELDMDRRSLLLFASSEGAGVEQLGLNRTDLALKYNYGLGEGSFELALWNPAEIHLSGSLKGGSFRSLVSLKDFLLVQGGLSAFVSYEGSVAREEELAVRGHGELEDVFYRDLFLGKLGYRLSLLGKAISLEYGSDGLKGTLKGTLGGSLLSITEFREFRRELKGYEVTLREGSLEFASSGNSFTVALNLKDASLRKDAMIVSFKGALRLSRRGGLEGSFILSSRGITLGERVFNNVFSLTGRLDSEGVKGSYGVDDWLKGYYSVSFKDTLVRSSGRVRHKLLSADYIFEGNPDKGFLKADLDTSFGGEVVKTELQARYFKEGYELTLSPFLYRYRVSEFKFGGLKVRGNLEGGRIELGDASLLILGRPVVSVRQKEGIFSIKEGSVSLSFTSSGALIGNTELLYDKKGGVSLHSEGRVNLDSLSFFIATPVGGKAGGLLTYDLSYRGGDLSLNLKNEGRVVTFSRYFAYPMDAWIELRALGRSLSAFLTLWRGESGMSANVGSNDLRNYYVYVVSRDLPVAYRTQNFSLKVDVSSEGWVNVSDLSKVSLSLDMLLSGEVEVLKPPGGGGKRREPGKGAAVEVELDVRFDTLKPIRLTLPEGYVYVKVRGWVGGSVKDPEYAVSVEFLSGELTYFGRRFFVRGGTVDVLKEKELEEKRIDISLVNPSEDMSIFINLRGELEDPQLVVWSEPPRSTQEILTKLVIGSTAEGLIPVAKTLFKQLGYIGNVRSGLASLLGVDITLSTQTGTQGEIGINVNIKKKIAKAFSIEYQQSTLKDPRATYYGGSIKLHGGTYFYGRIFADNTSEIKLRFIRKFDF